jgi:hypothetical protein
MKKRRERKFHAVIYFECLRNETVANEFSNFIERHTEDRKIIIVTSVYMMLGLCTDDVFIALSTYNL